MIIADRKPFDEIMSMLAPYRDILVLGCNECVTVCAVGGAKEVAILASQIRLRRTKDRISSEVHEKTIERQCDIEYLEELKDTIGGYDAVLSLACGCGVQFLGERYTDVLVLPGVNTTFMGVTERHGLWTERCQGCGNCVLHRTMGICPVTRCAKSIFNGPCGGSSEGRCEIDKDTPCAWHLIIERYKKKGMMDMYMEIVSPKDWSTARDGGPRKRQREDMEI
ncbi:MAG: methylenetetrahydrofolate reductase C-terminal domain-containing protein [Syntrophorhabdaceae bacterium]|nr:methylenetetrahydrofolate reductase C-terminal domain-containing protein [Syntrophorhabdaceae bacterium]